MPKSVSIDQELVVRGIVLSRHQAANYIRLGYVKVDGKTIKRPDFRIESGALIDLDINKQYVSRAGLKLDSVLTQLGVQFTDKNVLDVGSSTGGFSEVALNNGAKLVIAVDIGSDQMHPKLKVNPKSAVPDLILIDVSFISLRAILPEVSRLGSSRTKIIALVKPQFEAKSGSIMNNGVVKNNRYRRIILAEFENWAKQFYLLEAKADSEVPGAKGNLERFYKLGVK
jgi:23S rRNA (cytidine1920-2'-O)/16S rRNA (cytidine1409-2'-O)-methyltransferase